jgi:tetratricopeptide (TPR) repeat protein
MGDAYIRLRRYKEAIESLERVLELSRPEDVIFEAIGHCYHKLENYPQARFYYRKASHLNAEDSRIFYKIAITYFREENWNNTIKQLEHAMRIHRNQPEYNLLMGDALMQLDRIKEAAQHYAAVIKSKPKNAHGHEALIKCLMAGGFHNEAFTQAEQAYQNTRQNPTFLFLGSAALFGAGKTKEALVHLESALRLSPKGFKKMIDLVPGMLQKPAVLDLVNRYVRKKHK